MAVIAAVSDVLVRRPRGREVGRAQAGRGCSEGDGQVGVVDADLAEEVPQLVEVAVRGPDNDVLGVVRRVVPAADPALGRRGAGQSGEVTATDGGDALPGQLVDVAVAGDVDDAVDVLDGGVPGERVGRGVRGLGGPGEVVLADRAVGRPVQGTDPTVGAPERDDVGGAGRVVVRPRVAGRGDGVDRPGKVAMPTPPWPPPEPCRCPSPRPVDDVVEPVVGRETSPPGRRSRRVPRWRR